MMNLEKIEEILKNDPEMQKKLAAETRRLTDSGEKDIKTITAKAVKAVFDTDLTDAELNQVMNATKELNLDEMATVSAGTDTAAKVGLSGFSVVGCVASGGALGSVAGPVGTVVGAVVGGVVGGAAAAVVWLLED